jgi:ketosteroid isomerase-like protein
MKRIGLILLAACLSVLAQQENKSDPALAEARKAIDKGNSQWIEAWDKADASLIAALFAEDGILMRRNGKMSKGPKRFSKQ